MINIREMYQLVCQDKQKYKYSKRGSVHTDFMMTGITRMLDKSYNNNYEINIEKIK